MRVDVLMTTARKKIGLCKAKNRQSNGFVDEGSTYLSFWSLCVWNYMTHSHGIALLFGFWLVSKIYQQKCDQHFFGCMQGNEFIFCHAERYLDVMRLKIEALRCRKKMERPVETTSKKMSNKQAKLLAMEIINALKSRTSRIRSGNRGADFIMRYV